jgi:hypothetical protein
VHAPLVTVEVLRIAEQRGSNAGKAVIHARSFDHFVRAKQKVLRKPDRLGGLEIDYELDLRRLLGGQVARVRTPEDLVNVGSCPRTSTMNFSSVTAADNCLVLFNCV